MDDAELVLAAQGGDREALERLLSHHVDRLSAVCQRMTGNAADAADATQEALIAIVRGLPKYDARAKFSTWAYRVTVNACLDELRRRKRRPQPEEASVIDLHGGVARGPSDSVADRIDVAAALERIPEDFRAAVVLRDLCGLDYREIGEVLGVPPGTVRSRIARGRAALVPLLSGNPTADPERPSRRP